jgi:hypothetical protein
VNANVPRRPLRGSRRDSSDQGHSYQNPDSSH